MKFEIVLIHQQAASLATGPDRLALRSYRATEPTAEDLTNVPNAEAYLERLLGMRVHINQVE